MRHLKNMRLSLRFTAILALLCSLLFGCTTNRYLRSPVDANRGSITDHAEIVLRSGIRSEAVDIKVGNGFTQYVLIGTDSLRQIRTDEIDRLIVTDHIAGAYGGFLAGSVGGLIIGGVLVPHNPSNEMTPFIYVVSGLAIGSIGGAIYGGLHGPQDNYVFPPDSIKALNELKSFNNNNRSRHDTSSLRDSRGSQMEIHRNGQ